MDALEISDVYAKMAGQENDLRWKRYLLELSKAFANEWFGEAN